ncbi:Zn-dependent protease [Catellatospora sp. TT07R-123]|uniref:M50 family metallopeptidase n=1 Tax=Catellatospora sp. TT07R-123 TaxID=2733863 RepID=UPI001B2B4249|nr:site-2 protease family protein [Catellatospora sp. TT07R-123]GHJ49778.1 Zn-dependent protease [Catellatospora sp. TT07R-123]
MTYLVGLLLFALAILISVSLHEAGHMSTAKAFGMKVTRYFVGFGPTLWSFKRGETEYGVKGIPLGGFVRITGMTPQDEDADDERAMWRYPVWKRTIVMSAGSMVHFILAAVALFFVAIFSGLPNPALPRGNEINAQPAVLDVQPCVVPALPLRDCAAGDPQSPATTAGLRNGDRITAVNGTEVGTWEQAVAKIRPLEAGKPATLTVVRDGAVQQVTVTPAAVERKMTDGSTKKVSAIGVGLTPTIPFTVRYSPGAAIGASADFAGVMAKGTFEAMKEFPQRIPNLFSAIAGEERDPNTPISVVGASRLGGEAVEKGLWDVFWMLFISLNLFVGVFNLLPLLPLDGGHIAIAWFERIRSWVYARLRKPDPGRVDYFKLMPLTYTVILIFGAFTLLTVTADLVNPITIK